MLAAVDELGAQRLRSPQLLGGAQQANRSLMEDQDPETRKKGRVSRRKARQEIDSRLTDAYDGQADAVLDEIAELLDRQSRPSH